MFTMLKSKYGTRRGAKRSRRTRGGQRAGRLFHETLEPRQLLTTGAISGTVFEDLNADGARDANEQGLPGWTVVLEPMQSPITFFNPAPDIDIDDHFGMDVAWLGNDMLIGANRDDMAGFDTGAVYLYDGVTHELIRAFPCPSPDIGEAGFGGGILEALGANILASSAHKTIDGFTNSGVVYLIDSVTGALVRTFHNPTPEQDDNFGQTGAVEGSLVAISAVGDNTAGEKTGTVYLFDASTGDLLRTITNPYVGTLDNFGSALVFLNGQLLVSAKSTDMGATDAGAAYLFDVSTGELLRTFNNPTPQSGDLFGQSVATLGDKVLVGGRWDNGDPGEVYMFDPGTGELLRTFMNPTPAVGDDFGHRVTTTGNSVLIGAREDDTGAVNAGAAYLLDGNTGALLQTFLNPSPTADDFFGGCLKANGGTVLFGVASKDVGATNAGVAYLIELATQTATDSAGAYAFTGLESGQYQVREIVADGYTQTSPGGDGAHTVILAEGQQVTALDFGNTQPTKFYVVDDAAANKTFEYRATGYLAESYLLNTGNTVPRGAASTIAGDKVWVVDANKKVYVYDTSGILQGSSWTAGGLQSSLLAELQGIATNGTDVWLLENTTKSTKSDYVYRYTNAASRTSGSQNAASSLTLTLNSANRNPKDIVTDGNYLWVVDDSTSDKVFKYRISDRTLVGSWTIATSGATSPTGITIDPANVGNIWIVDSGTDRVYQYNNAATLPNGSTKAADNYFALAAGNTNPQGIADPPVATAQLLDQPALATLPKQTEKATDAALHAIAWMRKTDDALFRTGNKGVEAGSGFAATHRLLAIDSKSPRATEHPAVAAAAVDRSYLARSANTQRQQIHNELFAAWELERADLLNLGLAGGK